MIYNVYALDELISDRQRELHAARQSTAGRVPTKLSGPRVRFPGLSQLAIGRRARPATEPCA
jgi:hypothetical protein